MVKKEKRSGFITDGDDRLYYDLDFWEKYIDSFLNRRIKIPTSQKALEKTIIHVYLGGVGLFENADNYGKFNDMLVSKLEKFTENIAANLSKSLDEYCYISIIERIDWPAEKYKRFHLALSKKEMSLSGDAAFVIKNKFIKYYNSYWS